MNRSSFETSVADLTLAMAQLDPWDQETLFAAGAILQRMAER